MAVRLAAAAAAVLAAPALLAALLVAPLPAVAAADPGAGLHLVGGTSQYTDAVGVVHLLGLVRDDGATVEQPQAVLDLLDTTGTEVAATAYQFLPSGWLEPGEEAPFDYPVPQDFAFSGKWRIDHFTALPTEVKPSHAFTLSDVTGPTSTADTSILHGVARNDNGYPVYIIKVIVSFLDAAGDVVYVQPTDVNSEDEYIAPGASFPFSLPRESGTPQFDVSDRQILLEANEPGVTNPADSEPAVGPLVTSVGFPALPKGSLAQREHTPVTDGGTSLVPNPSASDVAAAARPGVVVRRHDAPPVNTGSSGAQPLVNAASSRPSPRTTAAYAPVALIALVGGYGLLATLGAARAGLASFRRRRKARRETLEALAPGAVGGYGAMPGSRR